MIALNPAEQLSAQPLHLVGAHRGESTLVDRRQVTLQKRVGERSHRHARARNKVPQALAIADHAHRARQLVGAPAQCPKVGARLLGRQRLGEQPALARQHLVGADHQRAGASVGHPRGLQLGKRRRHLGAVSSRRGHAGEQRRLIDHGWLDDEGDACVAQDAAPCGARRSKHERGVGIPRFPRAHAVDRSTCRLRMAAAVSSIALRVTSMTGQPRRSNSLRAAASSVRTAAAST